MWNKLRDIKRMLEKAFGEDAVKDMGWSVLIALVVAAVFIIMIVQGL